MSIVSSIDTIAKWAEEEICTLVKLKKPPELDEPTDELYDYERITPSCFTMFIPNEERLSESVPDMKPPFPSLCVQLQSGEIKGIQNTMNVMFWFSTWESGTHGKDVLTLNGDGTWTEGKDESFQVLYGGWRDAWNWADMAIEKLKKKVRIGNLEILKDVPIKFGPAKEKEDLVDAYPFWFAWLSFSVRETMPTYTEGIERFL